MASKMIRASSLSLFATQISLFLGSGLSMSEGLSLMQEDIQDAYFGQVVKALAERVEDRKTLTEAMTEVGGFPDYMIKMTRIGEESGNLEKIMSALSKFYEREQQLRERVKSAVVYPLMLLLMMSLVVLLLIVQVLPMFSDLLADLGGEMPGMVRGLMNFGLFVQHWYWLILIIIAVVIVACLLFFRTARGRLVADSFKVRSIFTRRTYEKMMAERFAVAMSYLLSSSVDLDTSLELARDILGNRYMAARIDQCREAIGQGKTLYEALYDSGIFPRQFSRMLEIGYKSGAMDDMMQQLVNVYEQEVDTALRRITGAIEPTFVAVLSVIVGVILVSVMLPMLEIMQRIG